MESLEKYVDKTSELGSDYLFITSTGKPVLRCYINLAFEVAAKQIGIQHVHPHMMRTTWVTMAKQNNISVDEIMKITGHTSVKMVEAYDKRDIKNNVSKRFVVI